MEVASDHPRLPCGTPVYRGCPCWNPPVCHRVLGDTVAKRQPFLVCLLVLMESRRRVCLAHVFVVVHHAHVQLRILTPLLDWKRCPSSQSSPFSVHRIISTKFSAGCGCSLQLVILFDTIFISFEISWKMFLLAVCSVAIHLIHVNANLFLSRKIDPFRMLSRLPLDITAIFATGYTLYFVSAGRMKRR